MNNSNSDSDSDSGYNSDSDSDNDTVITDTETITNTDDDDDDIVDIFYNSAEHGRLDIIIKNKLDMFSGKNISVAFKKAARYNHRNVLEYLFEYIPRNILHKTLQESLHESAIYGHIGILKYLIIKGLKNGIVLSTLGLLEDASVNGHINIVKYLCRKFININEYLLIEEIEKSMNGINSSLEEVVNKIPVENILLETLKIIEKRLEDKGIEPCPICFRYRQLNKTVCGHYFCRECLDRLREINKRTCPMCRTENSFFGRSMRSKKKRRHSI
jgi:hypothetical protein